MFIIIIKNLSDTYYAQNQTLNMIKTVHNERLANTVYNKPRAAAVLITVSYAGKRRNR